MLLGLVVCILGGLLGLAGIGVDSLFGLGILGMGGGGSLLCLDRCLGSVWVYFPLCLIT